MLNLSPSRLNDFLGCPHQAALWLANVAPDENADPTLDLVRKKGFEHEADVLAALEARFGAAASITGDRDYALRESQTRAALNAKVPLIYQAALLDAPWQGFPDFLVGRNGPQGFLYEPEDAKLARKPKGEHLLQLGIYAELLERVHGVALHGGSIHVAQGAPVRFDLRRIRYILRRLVRHFEAFAHDDQRASAPTPCAACSQCGYQQRCEAEWRAADSPFYVAGIAAAQIAKLAAAGVTTLAQLAELPATAAVEGIGPETLQKLAAQARLQAAARRSGQHALALLPVAPGRGFANLPPPDAGDLFFDMEGDPLAGEGLEYLFGIYGRLDGAAAPAFRPFWGHDPAEEKAAFEATMRLFIEQMRRHPARISTTMPPMSRPP